MASITAGLRHLGPGSGPRRNRWKDDHYSTRVSGHVLTTDDPVRVYQRFSTLNGLSNGRAEVIVGRGSFTESFPLFGFDLNQYELLFEEHLELFASALRGKAVTWSGETRGSLRNQLLYPPIESGGRLRTWSALAAARIR